MEGASNVFKTLKTKRIKIGLGSGLPLGFMEKVVAQVGWSMAEFDYFNSFDELGEGRPSPIMIFEAMHKLGISDKRKILKIGDTVVDIQEGKNAGVLVAGVLSGSQNEEMLKRENPDYLFNNLLKFNNL